ncbi:MFS transporter [Streptomyces sp. NPDC051020]|uniref:MFS transporter n=1 Tax=Streptomyces sp. NPDC051020 TaxID=3155409 RepID=UPI0034391C66
MIIVAAVPRGLFMPLGVVGMSAQGISLGEIGLAMSVYLVGSLIGNIPLGALADSYGARMVSCIGAFLYGASYLLYILCLYSESATLAILCWGVMGIARATKSGIIESWYVNSLDDSRRGQVMQIMSGARTWTLTSLCTGALLSSGLALAARHAGSWHGVAVTYLLPALLAILLSAADVLLTLLRMGKQARSETDQVAAALREKFAAYGRRLRDGLRAGFDTPITRGLLLGFGAVGLVVPSLEVYWQPTLQRLLGNADGRASLFGLVSAVSLALSAVVVHRLGKWTGGSPRKANIALFVGRLAIAALCIIAAYATSWIFALVWLTAFCIFHATAPLQETLLHWGVADHLRVTIASTNGTCLMLGGAIGNTVYGFLADRWGLHTVWLAAAVFALLSALIHILTMRSEPANRSASPVSA